MMNFKDSKILKNISYSLIANISIMCISAILIIMLPKFIGVDDYSMWQLYLFYTSHIGVFHFGWIDGIYLRYAGYYFEQLDRKTFTNQIILLFLFEVMISTIGVYLVNNYIEDLFTKQVLRFVCLVVPAYILYWNCTFILHITNEIKKYSQLILFERLLFLILVVAYLLTNDGDYIGLLYLNTFSIYSSLIYGLYLIRKIFILKLERFSEIVNETFCNISVGSKLLIANLSGMLMLGIVRFGISQGWDVVTFGKISLTLSISNFFMVFINSISVVFFPILKRIDENMRKELYVRIRTILMAVLFIGLLGYYPLNAILMWWLPKYSDSLIYMAMLFPICLYESKVVLLTNTYLKSLRQEALMMKINFFTLVLSFGLTYACVVILDNLNMMVFSILLLFAVKSFLSEWILGRLLKLDLLAYILQEVGLTIFFVVVNYVVCDLFTTLFLYVLGLLVYLYLNKDLLMHVRGIRSL